MLVPPNYGTNGLRQRIGAARHHPPARSRSLHDPSRDCERHVAGQRD